MGKGRAPCCEKVGLKKGSWTPAEDMRLVAYIQKYGHGNWRSLPKQAGLLRCGKSCRLRWINYLRPDIKRGNFSKEEEDTLIKLHKLLGNKWSKIAAHMPGRTDNEIKNVWNTHLKKRLSSSTGDRAPSPPPANDSEVHVDEQFSTIRSSSLLDQVHTPSDDVGGNHEANTSEASTKGDYSPPNVEELFAEPFGSCSGAVNDAPEYSSSSSACSTGLVFEIPAEPQGLDVWDMLVDGDLLSATVSHKGVDVDANMDEEAATIHLDQQFVVTGGTETETPSSCSSTSSNSGLTECTAVSSSHDVLGFHDKSITSVAFDQINHPACMVDDEVQLSDMLVEPEGIWELLDEHDNQIVQRSVGSTNDHDQPHNGGPTPTTHLAEISSNRISSDDCRSWIQYLEKELDLSDGFTHQEPVKEYQEEDPFTNYLESQ